MLSIIITAKDESATIGRAISAFLSQLEGEFELIVVAPDRATLRAARDAWQRTKLIQDRERGKALAMNLAINEARGEKLIFSDGDVEIDSGAVKELLKIDADLVSGRPVADKGRGMIGWWQEVLVAMADKLRSERKEQGKFLLISGYLFLAKRKIFEDFKFDEELLTEDEYLSYWAWHQGYRLGYAGQAKVKVKFADNYSDWLKQKVRTLAGSYQIPAEWKEQTAMRSFAQESGRAWQMWKSYVAGPKQGLWMSLLFLARLDAWLRAFIKVKLLGQKRAKVWQRVESTKHE